MTTYAFIDSQNLNLGVQSQGWQIDFVRFRKYLSEKYSVEKAFLFIGFVADNQSLYTNLQKAGYIVIFKPTVQMKIQGAGKIKGNVDAELVLHFMIEYPCYDKAILVSGDGDFFCLVEYLENQGKLAKIIAPNRKYSSLLRKFSRFVVLADLFKEKVRRQ